MSEININTGEVSVKSSPTVARWYDALVILIVFNLAQIIGGAVCGFLAPLIGMELPTEVMLESVNPEVVEYVRFLQSRMVAVSYFIAMVVGLILLVWYARWRGLNKVINISFKHPGWASPFRLLCGYLLMWCVTIALEPLAELLPGDQSSLGGGGWLLVSAVLLAPFFEEIVFRGYITGALKSAYGGLVAWIGAAVIFGVAHVIPSIILTASFAGLVLGFYYLRYRSLMMVIILHAMNNLTACFLQTIDMSEATMYDILGGGALYWTIYGVCVAVSLAALSRMAVVVSRLKSDNIEQKM